MASPAEEHLLEQVSDANLRLAQIAILVSEEQAIMPLHRPRLAEIKRLAEGRAEEGKCNDTP